MNPCEKCKEESEDLTEGLCAKCTEEEESISSSQQRLCPCNEGEMTLKKLMNCTGCNLWWHPECVGLAGLSHYATKTLTNWKCYRCFSVRKEIAEKLGESDTEKETDTIKDTVREEMKARMPEVIGEIVSEVKAALGESSLKQLAKEANDTIIKSWADIAKTEQKRVISDVVEKTSESAMQKSLGRISADLMEQTNRLRNCVLTQVPEGSGGTDVSLAQVVGDLSSNEVSPEDIAHCKRLGVKKTGENRLILVVFKREQMAAEFHNFGRGRKIGNTWVNPDLTRTEREAKYQMRVERRRKLEDRPQRPVRHAAAENSGRELHGAEEEQQQQPGDNHQQLTEEREADTADQSNHS